MKLIKTINVYSEENYDLFEEHPNNREIKESHVNSSVSMAIKKEEN